MAAGLYRMRCHEAGGEASSASAGFLGPGVPVPEEVLDVMAARRVDLRRHRSRTMTAGLVHRCDLVATMTRQQLLDVAIMAPNDWTRCFTLVDLVRRAEAIGPVPAGMEAQQWVRQLHGGRSRAGILRLDLGDDIDDPMGGRLSGYRKTADRLDDLVGRLARLVCAPSTTMST